MPRPQPPSLPAAPKRQTEVVPVSPLIGDVLLYEVEDYSRRELPDYGTIHPKHLPRSNQHKYPNHKLVLVRPVPNARDGIYELIYAADRDTQDLYNFQFTQADIGSITFDAVQRDYITLRDDFTPDTPTMGTTMADSPTGVFSGTFVLANRAQIRTDKELDSLYIAERRTYVKKVTVTSIEQDDLNGEELREVRTLYYATETVPGTGLDAASLFAAPTNSFWGLQANSTSNTGQQLSAHWYAITSKNTVGGMYSNGVVQVGTWSTNENFYWPPVLTTLGTRVWARRDGGQDLYVDYVFDPEGYRGPCAATVERTWSKTPQLIPQVEIQLPEAIQYESPGFTVNIPPCLHAAVFLQCDYGTGDPVYKPNVGSRKDYDATVPTSRPGTAIASDEQIPFRGGYLRTRVTVTAPAGTP